MNKRTGFVAEMVSAALDRSRSEQAVSAEARASFRIFVEDLMNQTGDNKVMILAEVRDLKDALRDKGSAQSPKGIPAASAEMLHRIAEHLDGWLAEIRSE